MSECQGRATGSLHLGLQLGYNMWLRRCIEFSNGFVLIFFKTNTCVSFALSKLSVYLFMFVLKCQNKHYFLANECSFFKT